MKGLKFSIALVMFSLPLLVLGCGGSSSETAVFTGTVEAREVDVGTEIGGKVILVGVSEGDGVKAGSLLVELDATTLRLQVEQAEAALESSRAKFAETASGARNAEIEQARASVEKARAVVEGAKRSLDMAETNLERVRALFDAGAVSQEVMDNAQNQYDQSRVNLDAAESSHAGARAQLDLVLQGAKKETLEVLRANATQAEKALKMAEANLTKARVLSPAEGVVASVNTSVGEMVNSGFPVATLVDLTDMWVEIYIPEKYLGKIGLGQEARVSILSFPDKSFGGRITYISPEGEFTPEKANTEEERADTVFQVRVKLLEGLDKFKPGMSADVTFSGLEARGDG